jgi:hypothetical protein
MRAFLTVCLITLISLTNLAAVNHLSYSVQEQSPITLEAYWELVRNTHQAVVQLEADVEQAVRTELDGLASQWESVSAVELSDKSVIQIDPAFLVTELKTDPPDLEHLKNLLDALLRAHDEYPHKVFTIQDIEPLNEILARPEFQWAGQQSTAAPDWVNSLLEAFFNFMERLAFGLQNMLYYGRVPIIVAAVLLFLFSLYYISRSLSRNLVRESQLAAESNDEADLLSSRAAMQRAQTLSGQGDYRNAVRYLYLSSLLILDEQGLLRYDRSRTNREYLRSVSSQPQLAGSLRDVIDVFDRVWYGFEAVDEEVYRSYVEHVEELREKQE